MTVPSDHDELSSRRREGGRPATDELRLRLGAEMSAPSLVRERLDAWLGAQRWPRGQHADLVLAVSEAVSNSVEHGYQLTHDHDVVAPTGGGVVEVVATVHRTDDGRRQVVVTIRDEGAWLPPSAIRGNRRHGLPLMDACVETVEIDGTADGTTVVLRSRPVPPPV